MTLSNLITKIITYFILFIKVRGLDRCKLFCRVQDSSTYYLLGASVVDGTQCGADTFDACVAGQCVAAGCDHVLGSGMKLGQYPFGQ